MVKVGIIANPISARDIRRVISHAGNLPINDRAKHWTADDHPADWREQQQRWDRLHYLRVAVIVAAYVLVLVAAVAH